MENLVRSLPGPILALGASGFIGSNLIRHISRYRRDVFGVYREKNWRTADIEDFLIEADFHRPLAVRDAYAQINPKTTFNCIGFASADYDSMSDKMYETNFRLVHTVLEEMEEVGLENFINAGTFCEYGSNCVGGYEGDELIPDTHYSVSKAAAASLIRLYGQKGMKCANVRLCSVYGPYQEPSGLIPFLISEAKEGRSPALHSKDCERDYIHVDDVCRAFFLAAASPLSGRYGESFNVGTGYSFKTGEIAEMVQKEFSLPQKHEFSDIKMPWLYETFDCAIGKAYNILGFEAEIYLKDYIRDQAALAAKAKEAQ